MIACKSGGDSEGLAYLQPEVFVATLLSTLSASIEATMSTKALGENAVTHWRTIVGGEFGSSIYTTVEPVTSKLPAASARNEHVLTSGLRANR